MSHWAEIDSNNIVLRVLVGDNNASDEGEAFMNSLGGSWVKTSFTGSIRKNFAGIGYSYRSDIDAFVAPQPYPSWSLDVDAQWQPPTPYPTDNKMYFWNEETTEWNEVV